jgi:hypothetical protein
MGNARIETETAILFNAKQLDRQRAATRDGRFCSGHGMLVVFLRMRRKMMVVMMTSTQSL